MTTSRTSRVPPGTATTSIVGVGFLMGDALASVATQFPETSFAIVDFPQAALEGAPSNARGLVFAEQEAGYLVGVAAATVADGGAVSAVGGQAVPAVVAFLAGYEAGAKATVASVRVLEGYSQDFVDQAKCKELALTQIEDGSTAVFAAAGGCGLGALQAAKEQNVWGIGVDNDQAFLGPHMLTSATKKVDVAVFDTIQAVVDGSFEGGGDTLYDVANDGVGYGEVSPDAPDRDALIAELDAVSAADRRRRDRHPAEVGGLLTRRLPRMPFRGPNMIPRHGGPSVRSSRCGTSRSGSRGSSRTTTSGSTCARGRCTRSSERTARASPR